MLLVQNSAWKVRVRQIRGKNDAETSGERIGIIGDVKERPFTPNGDETGILYCHITNYLIYSYYIILKINI